MSLFSVDNPIVKMALNTFLSGARKQGVKHILVTVPDGEGSPQFDTFTEPGKFLTNTQLETIKNHIQNDGPTTDPGTDNTGNENNNAG